jgi:peptide chain release factor subunit 1
VITRPQLDALVRLDTGERTVLSVMLDLAPERQIARDYRVAFDDLVRARNTRLVAAERKTIAREAERVRAFLADAVPHGQGVVIYSCTPADLWQVCYLAKPIQDYLYLGPRPYLRPLVDAMDEQERAVVALADSIRTRVLVVSQGIVEDSWSVLALIPGRHKQGGWLQANFQRHHDNAVDGHLRNVVERLDEFFQAHPSDRLILGGPVETVARLQDQMPRAMQARLAGRIQVELFAPDAEVLEHTTAAARAAERAAERQTVARLLETTGAGGAAVSGLEATLEAISSGRVQTLVLAADAIHAGVECPSCGRLSARVTARCSICDAATLALEDVIERAIERTLAVAGDGALVHGEAGERLHNRAGGAGAVLRYTAALPVTS